MRNDNAASKNECLYSSSFYQTHYYDYHFEILASQKIRYLTDSSYLSKTQEKGITFMKKSTDSFHLNFF